MQITQAVRSQNLSDLSYENFLKFFDTYYNPSNVLLYFYGDVDMDYFLEHMDTEYLSHFDKHDVKVEYSRLHSMK